MPKDEIERWLTGVALVPMSDEILATAETVTPESVATLDAVHLATALALAADGRVTAVMTFDQRLGAGASEHGLTVLAPG